VRSPHQAGPALIYANRMEEVEQDARCNRVRPDGNLFDTMLPLARRLADELNPQYETHASADVTTST
jgi:hypothetical protein